MCEKYLAVSVSVPAVVAHRIFDSGLCDEASLSEVLTRWVAWHLLVMRLVKITDIERMVDAAEGVASMGWREAARVFLSVVEAGDVGLEGATAEEVAAYMAVKALV